MSSSYDTVLLLASMKMSMFLRSYHPSIAVQNVAGLSSGLANCVLAVARILRRYIAGFVGSNL